MSLLRKGTEVVTIYPEETFTDVDGNSRTRAGTVGVVVRAVVQPITSVNNSEDNKIGDLTETKYRLRLAGGWPTGDGVLGAQSQVEWQGKRYAILGEPMFYTGSPKTSHVDYVMVRN